MRSALVAGAIAVALGGSSSAAERQLEPDDPRLVIPDSLRGRSGKLRARIVPPPADAELQVSPVARLFGPESLRRPAVWMVRDSVSNRPFAFITLLPFGEKRDGRVGSYRVGRWPSEGRTPRDESYRVPAGFIEVTEENADLRISENFRLRDFLDRSQRDVWPKALVLDERLVDKLELILEQLRLSGHVAPRLGFLSAFRTPQANARGARSSQTPDSRHQYGDAADIIVDADGDGRMDDLNGDRRVDLQDVMVLVRHIEAVERRYPELTGGIGIYRAAPGGTPFVHVDTRGVSVRWEVP